MKEITLKDYVKKTSQKQAAIALEVTPGAVWQMLQAKRDIFFAVDAKGNAVSWREAHKPRKRPGPKPGFKKTG